MLKREFDHGWVNRDVFGNHFQNVFFELWQIAGCRIVLATTLSHNDLQTLFGNARGSLLLWAEKFQQ
ncbi:Uncharacterised protein [Vibrio cholerae]|uniref:Uncharacterized protein n=1 Tax=Vibrio cholerae TaxID=666 RepID=A0A655USJ6_VIBCL|nr:Uncharacterised protein [Vibrio cholerae]CSB55399.1 Uncharacterised protein [Vibrio cholerae]